MKGLRFFAPDYGLGSSELLLKGLKYQINVPIYNASFVDAKGITVRLSYAQTNEYNATRTKIQDLSLDLPGWGADNRVWANFEWTPDVADGTCHQRVLRRQGKTQIANRFRRKNRRYRQFRQDGIQNDFVATA